MFAYFGLSVQICCIYNDILAWMDIVGWVSRRINQKYIFAAIPDTIPSILQTVNFNGQFEVKIAVQRSFTNATS